MVSPNIEAMSIRASAIFEERIKALGVGKDPYDFLAIDVVSGDYEVAADDLSPSDELRVRHPDAVIYLRRVGDEAAYTVGGGFQS